MSDMIHVGTVLRPRGNKGEVAVDCPGGHPERLVDLDSVRVGPAPDRAQERRVRRAWLHESRLVLHFEGIDTIDAAETLRGERLFVERSRLVPLPEGTWYTFDLLDCVVMDAADRVLGRVVDTEEGGAQDRLVVETTDGRRVEVPMARGLLLEVDVPGKRVRVDPPAGLLEGEPETVPSAPRRPGAPS